MTATMNATMKATMTSTLKTLYERHGENVLIGTYALNDDGEVMSIDINSPWDVIPLRKLLISFYEEMKKHTPDEGYGMEFGKLLYNLVKYEISYLPKHIKKEAMDVVSRIIVDFDRGIRLK